MFGEWGLFLVDLPQKEQVDQVEQLSGDNAAYARVLQETLSEMMHEASGSPSCAASAGA